MAYGEVRVCSVCETVYVEDDHMWVDAHCCPQCGTPDDAPDPEAEEQEP